MAAIAKFVSFDGGVAFSEKVMKIQNADQEAVTIPLDDVTAVRIRKPQEDSEGFIRIETAEGRRYRIFFDDDQIQEAIQFKKQFDDTVSDFGDDYALAPAPEKNVTTRQKRPNRDNTRAYREYSERAPKKPIFKRWWVWAICAVLVIGIIGQSGNKDDKKEQVSENNTLETAKPVESVSPTETASPTEGVELTSMETLCSLLEMTISDNFDHYDISYEDDTITVSIWQDGIAASVTAIQMVGGDSNNSDWVYLKNSVKSLAESLCGLIDTAGRTDVYLYTSVQNDQNTDNTLLMYLDTTLIYDCLA